MNKKLMFCFAILIILSINFVSAGLCKGYDGYYHDCDDYGYFDKYDRNYDDYYYYHGKYYPARDYYYREYYRSRYRTRKYDTEIHYEDVEEYSRTINYEYKDRYGTQKLKTVISEKTEIELDYDKPYYVYRDRYYSPKGYDGYYRDYGYYEDDYYRDSRSDYIKPVPYHYSLYKQYY